MENKTESKKHIINLKIEKEKDLYNPFDLEKNLNDSVKNYIIDRASDKSIQETIHIRIIHEEPVNEEDVKVAFLRWIENAKLEMKRKGHKNMVKQIWLFAIGLALISLSLYLQSRVSTLQFTVISTLGTFSIWEGASVWILQTPALNLNKLVFRRLTKAANIEFIQADKLEGGKCSDNGFVRTDKPESNKS